MSNFFKRSYDIAARHLPPLAFSALCAWLFVISLNFLFKTDVKSYTIPDFANSTPLLPFLALVLLMTALLFVVHTLLCKKVLPILMPILVCFYGAVSSAKTSPSLEANTYTAIAFCVVALVAIVLSSAFIRRSSITLLSHDVSTTLSFVLVCVAFVLFSAFFIVLLWARTRALCSPCYDMGIFAQMYDNMTDSFLPITTCERGESLSHFAVHFSPVLYLLLPFCYIFRPDTVLVFAQILLVFSAVFPLWLICKRIGLSNILSCAVSVLFLLYPAMSSGAFYDFHENAFLAPFILWTLYFIHTKSNIPIFIFALATLTVKEDAAIYVAFIALYCILSRKRYIVGLLLLALTLGYFGFASYMLMQGGQGMMLGSRYYNVIGYEGSFVDLLRVLLVNPALYAAESFTAEKLLYFVNMLLPLALLPLICKRPSRLLLLAPLFVMNLIPDYKYQHDLGFQYSFGSGALLVYLAALNLADLSHKQEEQPHAPRRPASAIVAFALICSTLFVSARIPAQSYYLKLFATEKENVQIALSVLDDIDRSSSVMATSFYLTPLYDVDELYHSSAALDSNGKIKIYTDVVVLDLRPYIGDSKDASRYKREYIKNGYKVTCEKEDIIMVLERQK